MKKYDLIVVGMGPGGVFCAYELIQKNKHKNILLIEQGRRIENRNCPIEKTGKLCYNKSLRIFERNYINETDYCIRYTRLLLLLFSPFGEGESGKSRPSFAARRYTLPRSAQRPAPRLRSQKGYRSAQRD